MPRRLADETRGQSATLFVFSLFVVILFLSGLLYVGLAFEWRVQLQSAAHAAAIAGASTAEQYESMSITWRAQQCTINGLGNWMCTTGPEQATTLQGPTTQLAGWAGLVGCGVGGVVCAGAPTQQRTWWEFQPGAAQAAAAAYFASNTADLVAHRAAPRLTSVTVVADGTGRVTVAAEMPVAIPLFWTGSLRVAATARPHDAT